jgi:hypothetical protein
VKCYFTDHKNLVMVAESEEEEIIMGAFLDFACSSTCISSGTEDNMACLYFEAMGRVG